MELSEAETVDVLAAAVLCGTKTVGVPATFAGSKLPVFCPRGPT